MIVLRDKTFSDKPSSLIIEDVFHIMNSGTTITGKINSGTFSVGDKITIYDANGKKVKSTKIIQIMTTNRKLVDTASVNTMVGILLDKNVSEKDIKRGMVVKTEYKSKLFSRTRTVMVDKIVNKLDKEGIEDYDIVSKVSKEFISINSDLNNLTIYIPEDLEYVQYEIDDYIRSLVSYARTSTKLDRDIYVMKLVTGKLTEDQYYKLVKYIIAENDFCALIDSNNL